MHHPQAESVRGLSHAGNDSQRRGSLVVVAGPSGAGKSTLLTRLLEERADFSFAVSCTTRAPRPGEVEGREYYFIKLDEFSRRVQADEFVEWEELHANRYGTLKSEIDRLRDIGRHVLLDLDVKGALSVRRSYVEALLVFIAPPSLELLEQRLRERRSDSEEQIRIRMARCAEEMDLADRFEHVVINDDLEECYRRFRELVQRHADGA